MTAASPTNQLVILPLTPARWADFAALFDEGGDPKTCSCMFWRLRSRDWSFANAAETREGMRRLVEGERRRLPSHPADRVAGLDGPARHRASRPLSR